MAKVTVNNDAPETPTQKLLADANKTVTVEAPSGRTYTLKAADLLSQFYFLDAMGPETARNPVFMTMGQALLSISKLDGEPVPMIKSRMQFDNLLQKVNQDYRFILDAVDKHFNGKSEDAEEADKQTLKNS